MIVQSFLPFFKLIIISIYQYNLFNIKKKCFKKNYRKKIVNLKKLKINIFIIFIY